MNDYKILDCITFFDNNFIFDLRYNILKDHVDYFVICESKFDHRNKVKKLNFNITVFSFGDEHKIIEKDNFTEIIWKNNSFLDLFKLSSLQDYSKGVIDSSNNLFIKFLA